MDRPRPIADRMKPTEAERMEQWRLRIEDERKRDSYYSQPDVKHSLLVERLGPDYLRDWEPINGFVN